MGETLRLREVMLRASMIMITLALLSKVLGYVFHLSFARLFTQEIYGQYIYLFSWALFIVGLTPNIAASTERYIAFFRGANDIAKVQKTIRTGLALSISFTLIVSTLTYLIYGWGLFPNVSRDFEIIFIIFIFLIVVSSNFFGAIITGYRRPEISSAFLLLLNIIRISALFMAAYLFTSLSGILETIEWVYAIYLILMIAFIAGRYGLGTTIDKGIGNDMFRFGVFTLFFETANNVLNWADIMLLNLFMGSSTVAIYNIAWLASTSSLIFFMASIQIFKPIITEFFGAGKTNQVRYLSTYMLESFTLLSAPVAVFIALYADKILELLVGATYASGAAPLRILIFGSFLFGLAIIFMELIVANGKPQHNAINIGVAAGTNIGLNLLLIPRYGMVGSASATVVSSLILLGLSYIRVNTFLRVSVNLSRTIKIIFCTFGGISIAVLSDTITQDSNIQLILAGLLLIMSYPALLVMFKALREEDVQLGCTMLEKIGFGRKTVRWINEVFSTGVR